MLKLLSSFGPFCLFLFLFSLIQEVGQRESCCNLCQKVYCGWQILNHWTIKEVPAWSLLAFLLSPSFSYFHDLFSVFLLASPPFNLSIFFCFFFFVVVVVVPFLSYLLSLLLPHSHPIHYRIFEISIHIGLLFHPLDQKFIILYQGK